jgi:hypothetical protein
MAVVGADAERLVIGARTIRFLIRIPFLKRNSELGVAEAISSFPANLIRYVFSHGKADGEDDRISGGGCVGDFGGLGCEPSL